MKAVIFALCGCLLLSCFGLYPFEARKIADLQPAQVLVVEQLPFAVAVTTDNGLKGVGRNYDEAMARLEATAPGKAFFACCSAVVLSGSEAALPDLLKDDRLRPAAAVYVCNAAPAADQIAPILAAHAGDTRIADLQRGETRLPRLTAVPEGWLVEDGS